MDQPFKSLLSLLLIFIGMLLLVSCLTFSLRAQGARSTLAEVIEYLEIYGYDPQVIEDREIKTDTRIVVQEKTGEQGRKRYQVTVSFDHFFTWLNIRKEISYQGLTRLLEA